jgi:hypothetical protein
MAMSPDLILDEQNVEIRRGFARFGKTTYSVANITSVSLDGDQAPSMLAGAVGLLSLVLAGVVWYYSNWIAAVFILVVGLINTHVINWKLGGGTLEAKVRIRTGALHWL